MKPRAWKMLLATGMLTGCATAGPPRADCVALGPVLLPSWAARTELATPAAALLPTPREPRVVRITPAPERDPVDELLRARGGSRNLGSLSLRDAPVTDTLRLFAELGRFNLVFASEVADRRVTIDLRNVSVAAAFRAVLAAARLGASVLGGEIVEVAASQRGG